MKGCPLCSADDDDSEWSSSCGSPRSTNTNRVSQYRKRLPPLPHPLTPSKFKECKEDEPSATSSPEVFSPKSITDGCLADGEFVTDESDRSSEPYDVGSLRQKELKDRFCSAKLPPLPLTGHQSEMDISTVAHSPENNTQESEMVISTEAHFPENDACTSSGLKQLVQHRKEKIRELKIRRLVPPSQRYQNFNVVANISDASHHMGSLTKESGNTPPHSLHSVNTSRLGSESLSFHSEASHHMGNLTNEKLEVRPKISFHPGSTIRTGNSTKDKVIDAGGTPIRSFHSGSTNRMENLTGEKPSDARGRPKRSFHSGSTNRMGNSTKDKVINAGGKPIPSFHSESTKRMGNLKGNSTKDQLFGANQKPKVSFHSESTERNLKRGKHYLNASSLEISYDSFVEQNGKVNRMLRRVDSDEITVVSENTSSSNAQPIPPRLSSMESIPESEIDSSIDSASNFDVATYDIWDNGSVGGSTHGSSANGRDDRYRGGGDVDPRRSNEIMTQTNSHAKKDLGGNEHHVRKSQQDATTQTAMIPPNSSTFDDLNRQLQSLRLSVKNNETRLKNREGEKIVAEDVSEEEYCDDIQADAQHSVGSHIFGHTSVTSLEQSEYHPNARPDANPPDVTLCSDGESDSSCSSYDTLAQEGLDDYWDSFDKTNLSSPQGRERKKLRLQDERQERPCPYGPYLTRSTNSNSSPSTEPISLNSSEIKSSSSRDEGIRWSNCSSNPPPRSGHSQSSPSTESSSPQHSEMKHSSSRESRDEQSHSSSNPSTRSCTSYSLSSTESIISPRSSERKRDPQKDRGMPQSNSPSDPSARNHDSHTPSRKRRSSRLAHEKRGPGSSVDRYSSSSQSDAKSRSSAHTDPIPTSQGRESGYIRQESDSSQESMKTFSNCDAKGRCIHHPHVQLRRKRRLGGWNKGKWKIIMLNCTECCFDEVQRLRTKNLRAKEQLRPPASGHITSDKDDTSATESVSSTSVSDSSNDSSSSDLSSDATSPGLPHRVQGILKRITRGGDESSASSGSTSAGELTTTFSYLSSLSGNSTSACSSSTTGSSATAGSSYPSVRPMGILRNHRTSSSGRRIERGGSGRSRHSSSTRDSGRSQGSRVVFAGRDQIMDI